MKQTFLKYTFLLLLIHTGLLSSAQETTEKLSSITLSIADPQVSDKVTETNKASLVSKIENMITEGGVGSADYSNNFVIQPKFIVTQVQKTSGGMRSVAVADCSFSLTVMQQNSGGVFSQYAKSIKGSGMSEEQAITNAISQIEESDEKAIAFIAKAKDKIIAYYKQNCSVILQKAEKERSIKNYESSLSILLTIPEEAGACYQQGQAKAKVVFKELQNYECKKYLQQAQTYAANQDYDNALQTLSFIDPTGNCTGEAKSLIKKIDGETSADKKKQWQYVFKQLDGSIEVEKARTAAMTNLTMFWLKQQSPRTIIVN
ncbi:MAG TPA: hypothetical protein VIJ57_11325 [Hanamia sp.]